MREREISSPDHYKILLDGIKEEDLETAWDNGEEIKNTTSIKYFVCFRQPVVIKKVRDTEDFEKHVEFYKEIVLRGIRTPKILSIDKNNLKIKYTAVGVEKSAEEFWSKTLVNFEYDPGKECINIDFLVRTIKYALWTNWEDLYSGNILFEDGYLYLTDYVPGRGENKIGSFGLQKIKADEKAKLRKERFDYLLEEAFKRVDSTLIDYSGLEALKETKRDGCSISLIQ